MQQLVVSPRWLILSAALVAVLLAVSVSTGMAFGSSMSASSRPRGFGGFGQTTCNQNGFGGPQFANSQTSDPATEIASALNLSVGELQQQIASGHSLNQILTTLRMTTQQVMDAVTANLKDQLNQQVAAGRMTLGQEDALLASNQANINDVLSGKTSLPAIGRASGGIGRPGSSGVAPIDRGRFQNCGS